MTTALVYTAVLIFILGLFAVIVERTEQRDAARRQLAEAWERIAERDERITRGDRVIARLSHDKFLTDLADYDAATTEPVPFIPADGPHLRLVEESPYDWPRNTDDAWWTRLYDQNGEVQ